MSIKASESNLPDIQVLSRRDFLHLTGMSLGLATMAAAEVCGGDSKITDGKKGAVQMKISLMPCCSPAYRAIKTKDESFVVWRERGPDEKNPCSFHLNRSGGAILRLCDGSRSLDAVVKTSASLYGIREEDATAFLKKLKGCGIVVQGGSVTFNPAHAEMQSGAIYRPRFE